MQGNPVAERKDCNREAIRGEHGIAVQIGEHAPPVGTKRERQCMVAFQESVCAWKVMGDDGR